MRPLIADHLGAIRTLAREYGVVRLEVFGSVCTPEFDPARGDVDFLVEYPEGYDFGSWMGRHHALRRALEAVLGRRVELGTPRALRDPLLRAAADAAQRPIFDASAVAPAAWLVV